MLETALAVLGILILAGLVAVARFALRLRRELAAARVRTPSTITLEPIAGAAWARESTGRSDGEAFEQAGFQRVGSFEVPEMPGVELVGWAHPGERLYGVTYNHAAAGVWSDVVARYADGTGDTASSARHGGELDQPPWSRKAHEPGAPAVRLLEIAATWPAAGRLEATVEGFVEDFRDAYAREMAWRNERGGPSREEIARVAEGMEVRFSAADIDQAYDQQRRQTLGRLRDECVEALAATGVRGSGGSSLDQLSLLVIHDQMSRAEAIDELGIVVELPEELMESVEAEGGGDPPVRELVRELVGDLPVHQRLRLLGSVADPVGADVWEVPDGF